MTNTARGDCALQIDGKTFTLRLTLAALCEIEAGLHVSGFTELSEALKQLDAKRLNLVLTALLRAGGAEDAEAFANTADPLQAVQAVAACFKANLQ